MTVKDLILKLSEFDPELEVKVEYFNDEHERSLGYIEGLSLEQNIFTGLDEVIIS